MPGFARSVEMLITELQRSGAGQLIDTPTSFRLRGVDHSSNLNDLEMHLQVKTSRRDIPGSNEVVEHVMAATWQPITFNGEWLDKWGNRMVPQSNGSFVSTGSFAYDMYLKFSAFVRRTSMCRVQIDRISLIGIITDLTIKYRTQKEIGWSFVLSPHDNEGVPANRGSIVFAQPINRWIDDSALNVKSANATFAKLKSLPLKAPRVELLDSSFVEINAMLDRLSLIGSQGFDNDVTSKLLLMATTFRRLRVSYNQLAVAIRSLTSKEVAFDDTLAQLRYAEIIETLHTNSMTGVGTSITAEVDCRRRAGQKPRAIYRPKRGEALERISIKFYGTPNSWRVIYDANNLSSILLSGLEELVIPERRT